MKAKFDANRMKKAAEVMKKKDAAYGVFEMRFTEDGLELLLEDVFTFSFDIPGSCEDMVEDVYVYAIPIDGFYKIASMWNNGEATVEIDGEFAVFSCGGCIRRTHAEKRLPVYSFTPSYKEEFNVDWQAMYSKVRRVGSACYDRQLKYYVESRKSLASVFVSFCKEDMEKFECIGTDGTRLHMTGDIGIAEDRIEIAIPYTKYVYGILELKMIVSEPVLKRMTASIECEESLNRYKLCLHSNELGMYTEFSLPNKEIPPFRSVIPKEFSSEIEIGDDISSLVSSLAKRKYSEDEFVSFRLYGCVANCRAMCGSETAAEASGKGTGEIEKINFDPKMLHEAICCAGDGATLMVNKFNEPAGIKGRGGFCVLMPRKG